MREPDRPQRPFGELLRIFRLKADFSQEALAERAGISVGAVSAIEQGARRAPYRHTVALLAEALGASPMERQTLEAAAERARGRKVGRTFSLSSKLPRPLTPFINRPEVEELMPLIERHRLVTITGSGGIGKTRTAIEVSYRRLQQTGSPVSFVDLSSLRDGSLVVAEIAAALEVDLSGPNQTLDSLVGAISSCTLCLVLDNCEHLIADVSHVVGSLLRHCPSVSILTTSRELLGMTNEAVYRLPSLQIPKHTIGSIEEAQRYPAFALFMQRVNYADPRLVIGVCQIPAIIDICRKLEGIPLAIELAAGRVPTTGLETLRNRLNEAFVFSGGNDLPSRQQTMEATILWSYELLDQAEQTLLQRLSVFAARFTLESAELVCADAVLSREEVAGLLTRLVDKSLVNAVSAATQPRYSLQELIRAFASERLNRSAELTRIARRHAEWLAVKGESLSAAVLNEMLSTRAELDNARAATEWCLQSESQTDVVVAARILGGWSRIWGSAGRYMEFRQYVADVLQKLDDVEANFGHIASLWCKLAGTYDGGSYALLEQASPFLKRCGDAEGIAVMQAQLALGECRAGAFDRANDLLALAKEYYDADERRKQGASYYRVSDTTAWVFCAQGKIEEARAEILTLDRQMKRNGADALRQARRLNTLSEIEFASGSTNLAIELSGKALNLLEGLASRVVSTCYANLCNYLLADGNLPEAERRGTQALALLSSPPVDQLDLHMLLPIQHLAAVAALNRRSRLAAALLGFLDASYRRFGVVELPETDKRSYEILITSLREQLSTSEIARLRLEGETLDFEAACELLEMTSEWPVERVLLLPDSEFALGELRRSKPNS